MERLLFGHSYVRKVGKSHRFCDLSSPLALEQLQSLSCKLELASDQEIPADWFPFVRVECEVADAVASHTRVKSVGIESDVQPQKHLSSRAYYHCQVKKC